MSKTFTVKVRGKIAAAEYTEPYVCDNSDYEIEFDFSEEWQVYELKTARFAYGGKMQDIIFEGSRCGVPRMSGICSFKVGVFAGDLSTTTPAYIEARASILSEGGTPAAPAPDVYDQLMQRMNEIEAPEAVLYTEQILTDEQKAQARANINADRFEVEIYRDRGTPYSDKTTKEIYDAFASGKTVEIAVDLVRAMLTECRMQNDKYYISCYVPRVTEAYTVAGLGSYMLYLDGALGTARGIWKEGLYNVTATSELAPITGVVTADKLFNPDHPTDLVAYEAFTAAVPLVQSMNLTGATVGQTIKVKAVNKQGMPTAWEAADMVSGSSGEVWEKVADTTLTEQVNSIRVTFSACSTVYVQFQWGGVESDLGNICIAPNCNDTFYTGERRAAAASITTSTNAKRGYAFIRIDTRVGSVWTATSSTLSRGDGSFGAITPDDTMNCEIGVSNNFGISMMTPFYFTVKNEPLSNGVHSITAYGAGMAIGTTLRVWGIKK